MASAPVARIDEANVYHAGTVGFEALFDKLWVIEDEFRSGYECQTCNEAGKIACSECDTGYSRINPDIKCKSCEGSKSVTCPDCGGKGALLHMPDNAKRRPTTGVVVSVGPDVQYLKRGDTVLFPNFVGEAMELNGLDAKGQELKVPLHNLREKEVISKVWGHMSLRRASKIQFNVGG